MRIGSTLLGLGAMVLLLNACAAQSPVETKTGFWPGGKKYCVTLTYDDGLKSQIQHALPQLEQHGMKATFFFSGKSSWSINDADVKLLAASGHELAAHTLLHPCSKSMDFVKPGQALEDYDEARMSKELDENLANLNILNSASKSRTFAFPCGMNWIGENKRSYTPLVKQRFIGARGVVDGIADPKTVDLFLTPGLNGHEGGALKQIEWLRKAKQSEGWAIYMFHGVGGDYLSISAEDHQKLLAALEADSKNVWVATFSEAVSWIKKKRPGN